MISPRDLPAGNPSSSKASVAAACAKPSSGTDGACRAPSPINCTKLSIELAVAASALAIDSVEGQRWRPSAVTRFDLLKVVGSRPDFLASPDADNPARSANRSSAVQICSWVSTGCALGGLAMERWGQD